MQKYIVPYVLEYYLLCLIIIALDIKFTNYQIKTPRITDGNFSFSDYWHDYKDWFIIYCTFFVFIMFSSIIGERKIEQKGNESKKLEFNLTFLILNGVHIMLLVNSIISLIFSILYFIGITD